MMDQQNDDPLMSADGVRRCFGTAAGQHVLARYHDEEWGVPVHDDRHLFEMLTLEGAQAGLSWDVVLRKRRIRRCWSCAMTPVLCGTG